LDVTKKEVRRKLECRMESNTCSEFMLAPLEAAIERVSRQSAIDNRQLARKEGAQ